MYEIFLENTVLYDVDHGSGMRSKRLFFVNYVFQTSMERETRQALDESSILRFALRRQL
ncbi:MAG: hypothetical protein ACLS5C_01715 [Waltera sp.]